MAPFTKIISGKHPQHPIVNISNILSSKSHFYRNLCNLDHHWHRLRDCCMKPNNALVESSLNKRGPLREGQYQKSKSEKQLSCQLVEDRQIIFRDNPPTPKKPKKKKVRSRMTYVLCRIDLKSFQPTSVPPG